MCAIEQKLLIGGNATIFPDIWDVVTTDTRTWAHLAATGKELYYRKSDLKQSPHCYDYLADKTYKTQ